MREEGCRHWFPATFTCLRQDDVTRVICSEKKSSIAQAVVCCAPFPVESGHGKSSDISDIMHVTIVEKIVKVRELTMSGWKIED